jgi:hypothetical protein
VHVIANTTPRAPVGDAAHVVRLIRLCETFRVPRHVPLLNAGNPPANSFVLPEHNIVYMSVTKVACTSLRWMVADLAGEDLPSFYRAIGGQQSRLMTIHGGRSRWRHTPALNTLSEEELAEISPDNGWFVFAVVRDPWTRLWSAWQSKFLVRHVFYMDNYGAEPWFPRVPEKASDVVEDYRRFVEAHPWTTNPLLMRDVHFKPQVVSVRPSDVNYTRIYDITDMPTLLEDVRNHLVSVGKPSELYVPRANETPLGLTREVLGNGVAESVEELFAPDFDAFGDRWSLDRLKMTEDGWSVDALRHVAFQDRGQRAHRRHAYRSAAPASAAGPDPAEARPGAAGTRGLAGPVPARSRPAKAEQVAPPVTAMAGRVTCRCHPRRRTSTRGSRPCPRPRSRPAPPAAPRCC